MEIEAEWANEFWSPSGAVLWILTKGGTAPQDADSADIAAEELFAALQSGKLEALGICVAKGQSLPETVPPEHFLKSFPFAADAPLEMIYSEAPVLQWGALYEADWRIGIANGDMIGDRHRTFWKRIYVKKSGVLALWPSGEASSIYHTGAPGRPSSIQFVEREWQRRRNAGEALNDLESEAKALHEWCKANHTGITAPKPGTIKNKIRNEFREWRARPHN